MNRGRLIKGLAANPKGEIFELDEFAAVGMAGAELTPLTSESTLIMPYGGEMMFLPDRVPIYYHIRRKRLETLSENPYIPGERIFPVAAFNSPGYMITYNAAYREEDQATFLPLFSYGAVGWASGKFRCAAIRVDAEKRQDIRLMPHAKIISGVNRMRKKMPKNRLCRHLERCALEYSCPAGKNFFLRRYEAPLPTSRKCNARCLGCISLQNHPEIPNTQNRITFMPTPEEIAEVAVEHIRNVKNSVVSFGQGCEGDPLFAAESIEPAIRMIRRRTPDGVINMNTNASRPDIIEKLFTAGLDSIRVSMNSARQNCYEAYFRPVGYHFSDVEKSIDIGIRMGKFVSINYLNCPGFTDLPAEFNAFIDFLQKHPIDLIQWRNLNYDPKRYIAAMETVSDAETPMGMNVILEKIRSIYPKIKYGYFNPSRNNF